MTKVFLRSRARRTLAARISSGERLRVLHVIGTLDRGGAETFLLNLVRSSVELPLEVHILCYGDRHFDLEGDFAVLGARVHRIARGSSVFQHWKALRTIRPDIVHAHTDLNAGLSLVAASIQNIGLKVAHSHSTVFGPQSSSPLRRAYERAMVSAIGALTDLRLACGNDAGLAMFRGRNFFVQQNGVDIEQFRFSRENRLALRAEFVPIDTPDYHLLLGLVARLEPVKNHAFMLRVFVRVLSDFPNAQLVLVGRGSCESSLRELANGLGIARSVHFLGVRNDVSELLSAFDAVALPSLYEGFPVSMIEAQVNGVPLIVSDQVDAAALLNRNCVRLPIQGNEAHQNWANYILDVARNRQGRVSPSSLALTFDAQDVGTQVFRHYQDEISKGLR